MKHNVTRLNWIVQFILIYLYESYQFEITIRLTKKKRMKRLKMDFSGRGVAFKIQYLNSVII